MLLWRAAAQARLRAMAETLALTLPDLAATDHLAGRVADLARAGDAILLAGPLGAGKSAFARAFLRHAAGDPALEVPSPTYTLLQSYDLPRFRAHHFDLWRLAGPDSLAELGWDECRADVVLVEWPERLGAWRPGDALSVELRPATADARTVGLDGWPDRLAALA